MSIESPIREPLIFGDVNLHTITEDVCGPTEHKPTKAWWFGFTIACCGFAFGIFCFTWEVMFGIGTWGLNKTIGWGFDITNFVWWIGIGHAGTLISAILLLFRQEWRNSINRSAEAMTIFAVMCAGMFPIFHMGRVWNAHMFLPLPNDFGPLWPNFNSPLLWDVFAISTYFTVSLVFWYTGLLPDLASIRDRATTKMRWSIYNFLSFGWTGSVRHWNRFELVSLILAGISTPLVLSVHTIVSFDFATSVIPGWHTTIFPPYFVAGAIFSGFAMVHTLLVVARVTMKLENYITIGHLEAMAKIITLTGSMVGIAYGTEFFMAWYSGYKYEQFAFINRAFGPYWWAYWSMITCNVITPQLFWFRKIRRSPVAIFILSIFVNIGMWFERFVIIVISLHRDFLPSSWAMYVPTWVEAGMFIGTIGFFFWWFFLFAKFFPVIAMAEVKMIWKKTTTGKPAGAFLPLQDYDPDKAYQLADMNNPNYLDSAGGHDHGHSEHHHTEEPITH
ncbi:MAG: polysulfide reductase NrfD [Bacteroidetes bacterium]|nr:polysulfide reductase NrfD [Bacteroidota bacterium]